MKLASDVCSRVATLALLTLADAGFLWMFLSTDPLAQLGAELGGRQSRLAGDAAGFAAAWRHGMAGNSWVYLPGFCATAAAVWLHARHAHSRLALAHLDRVLAGAIALVLARAAAPSSAATVVRAFEEAANMQLAGPIPTPSAGAMFSGGYTLCAWSVFVLACREALVRRTLRPFVVAALFAGGLVVIRPWTVDEFTSHWADGIVAGSASAWASFALVFVLAALLAAAERRSPQPQPEEGPLQNGRTAHGENADQVGRNRDDVEAGRLEPIESAQSHHQQEAGIRRR